MDLWRELRDLLGHRLNAGAPADFDIDAYKIRLARDLFRGRMALECGDGLSAGIQLDVCNINCISLLLEASTAIAVPMRTSIAYMSRRSANRRHPQLRLRYSRGCRLSEDL